MKDKFLESVVPFVALSFSVYYFVTVVEAPWEAKIYSYALIAGIFACTITILAKAYRFEKESDGISAKDPGKLQGEGRNFWATLALSVAFVVTIYLLGYILSAFLFILIAPPLMGYRKKSILLTATVVMLSIYLLFVEILKLRLPAGSLFG